MSIDSSIRRALDWRAVRARALDLVREQAERHDLTGPERYEEVLGRLVEWADDRMTWERYGSPWSAIMERADGPVLRMVLGAAIEMAVAEMEDAR